MHVSLFYLTVNVFHEDGRLGIQEMAFRFVHFGWEGKWVRRDGVSIYIYATERSGVHKRVEQVEYCFISGIRRAVSTYNAGNCTNT